MNCELRIRFMPTTKQLIWIYKDSPVAPGEIKSVKTVNSKGWFFTTDKKLIDPHWCCPCTDWQEYNGGFALFEPDSVGVGEACHEDIARPKDVAAPKEPRILETRDIKKYLISIGDWVSDLAIASRLGLSVQQVRTWLTNNQDSVESREVRDGYEWRLCANGAQNDNGSQKVNNLFTLGLDNAETLEDFEQLVRDNLLAFYTVGKALIEIRDRQLYIDLPDINTFEEYCQSPLTALRLGIKTKRRAYQLIDAAKIMDVLVKQLSS